MAEIVPYPCVFVDADLKEFLRAARQCLIGCHNRNDIIQHLQRLWTTPTNQNNVLPCLSVRSGFDTFLRVCNFPVGSEIIISAINIPDMSSILKHHGLTVVPLDIDLETTAPKYDLVERLISDKTVAIVLTHIYGKYFDVSPYISLARQKGLIIIEDCAEAFSGFNNMGNPQSDICMFSFGLIKYYTSFGGAILKVKDPKIYEKMLDLQKSYPVQSEIVYLKKLVKYSLVHTMLDQPIVSKFVMSTARMLNYDHKRLVVSLMRGYPEDLIHRIRFQPPTSLLYMMLHRQKSFNSADFNLSHVKGSYISAKLPDQITQVGVKASCNNYWLFPIVVDNPDTFVKTLNSLGIDAYRGATQLNIIEPENGHAYIRHLSTNIHRYPHEAKYLIDHVVYLPVNKFVPFHALDKISEAVAQALKLEHASVGGKDALQLQSKL